MKQDRKINVRMWVKLCGQEFEKIVELSSPLVSNMACHSLQRKADEAIASILLNYGTETGFEILTANAEGAHGVAVDAS